MATESDQARLVAERIARRVAGNSPPTDPSRRAAAPNVPTHATGNAGAELAEIRSVLTDLQRKLDRVASKINGETQETVEEKPRARFRDFVTSSTPANAGSAFSSVSPNQPSDKSSSDRFSEFAPPTHSPWLSGVYVPATHPSQEKFGVEEATVSELVEFFENEKKCSIEPGDKPCDHCAMCSSRGF